MNEHLKEVVETSKTARDKLIGGEIAPKEANAIASQNHNIIGVYALDLRSRIFEAEMNAVTANTPRLAGKGEEKAA